MADHEPYPNSDEAAAAHQAVDEGQDAVEKGAAIAQETAQSGLGSASEAMERSGAELKQKIAQLSDRSEDLARRSRQRLESIAEVSIVVTHGARDISRAWMDLAHARMQRSVDSIGAFARCRTPIEFVEIHSGLMQDNIARLVDTNRRVAEVSLQVLEAAAQKLTAEAQQVAA